MGGQVAPQGGEVLPPGHQQGGLLGGEALTLGEFFIEGAPGAGVGAADPVGADVHQVELDRLDAPVFVDLGGEGDLHLVAQGNPGAHSGGGEEDGAEAQAVPAEPEPQVPSAAHLAQLLHTETVQEKHRLGAASAAGLQLL